MYQTRRISSMKVKDKAKVVDTVFLKDFVSKKTDNNFLQKLKEDQNFFMNNCMN